MCQLFASDIQNDTGRNYNSMNKQDKFIKGIVHEYVDFLKKTQDLVDEAKRAMILSLEKALKLKDGDSVFIKEKDGSFEIEIKKNIKEGKEDE